MENLIISDNLYDVLVRHCDKPTSLDVPFIGTKDMQLLFKIWGGEDSRIDNSNKEFQITNLKTLLNGNFEKIKEEGDSIVAKLNNESRFPKACDFSFDFLNKFIELSENPDIDQEEVKSVFIGCVKLNKIAIAKNVSSSKILDALSCPEELEKFSNKFVSDSVEYKNQIFIAQLIIKYYTFYNSSMNKKDLFFLNDIEFHKKTVPQIKKGKGLIAPKYNIENDSKNDSKKQKSSYNSFKNKGSGGFVSCRTCGGSCNGQVTENSLFYKDNGSFYCLECFHKLD